MRETDIICSDDNDADGDNDNDDIIGKWIF